MANPYGTKSAPSDTAKAAGLFNMPSFDFEAVVASQRKLIEAVMQANTLAIEGWQALMRQQLEMGRQAMEQFSTMARDLGQPNGSLGERLAKQAAYSKQAIETGLANVRETGALMSKTGTEAANAVGNRVTESLDEARVHAKKHGAAS